MIQEKEIDVRTRLKLIVIIFLAALLILPGCTKSETTDEVDSRPIEVEVPAAPEETTTEPTEAELPTEAPYEGPAAEGTGEFPASYDVTIASCVASQSIFDSPDPDFPPVNDDDWAEGPPNAALTITEYSDFQ